MLFKKIPEKLFSILTSSKKELYVEALFVLRQAYRMELVIRRSDLIAMFIGSLESGIDQADFSEEALELSEEPEGLSGKAHLIFRKLINTGWIETEYEKNSYEENVTVPDYAIKIMNLLYDLTNEEQKEYNSYVFATFSSLKGAGDTPEYLFQALSAAYRNTVSLVDELKSLFNNIKRYHSKITDELRINDLLEEHFDLYKERVIDTIYYPLKTIDSVPRFKNSIMIIMNEWLANEAVLTEILNQGIRSGVYKTEEGGREDILEKINYIIETYEGIEELISSIDNKHVEYTSVSIDKIRYLLNSDRSIKGKLVYLLKHTDSSEVMQRLTDYVEIYQHSYLDVQSLNTRMRRSRSKEGIPKKIEEFTGEEIQMNEFLQSVKKQYGTKKIDRYITGLLGKEGQFTTGWLSIENTEEFILLMLGTIRGTEKQAGYRVRFLEGSVNSNGYRIPNAKFEGKEGK